MANKKKDVFKPGPIAVLSFLCYDERTEELEGLSVLLDVDWIGQQTDRSGLCEGECYECYRSYPLQAQL